MKLAIMQPYIFPYIGYFQLIQAVDKFVIFDDVNYINKGWINRNRILVNNQDFMLTIPLKGASQNKLISDIEIADDIKLRQNFLRTIEINYKKAPCFDQVFSIICQIVNLDLKKITEIIHESIVVLNKYLQIDTEIIKSSTKYNNSYLKGQNRIIDICKQEGASDYINPIGGVELYSKQYFEAQNIQLHFIKSKPVIYQQFSLNFIPWLSIIDVLMFNSQERVKYLINEYELL
jgi:hypothetical protein